MSSAQEGNTIAVQAVATDGNFFYAATTEGLKQAAAGSPDLADYHNWTLLSGNAGPGPGPCRQVISLDGKILALRSDSVFSLENNSWAFFTPATGISITCRFMNTVSWSANRGQTAGV